MSADVLSVLGWSARVMLHAAVNDSGALLRLYRVPVRAAHASTFLVRQSLSLRSVGSVSLELAAYEPGELVAFVIGTDKACEGPSFLPTADADSLMREIAAVG